MAYPSSLDSFTTKTAKQDKAKAADMNAVQTAIVAIQTELGTDPAGSVVDLKTRLAVSIGDDGAIRKGTSFPASPIDGQAFYRTDEDAFYIYNGSSWLSTTNLTNVVFSFGFGGAEYSANNYGVMVDDSMSAAQTSITHLSWQVHADTYREILSTKFKKISGVNTVTVRAYIRGTHTNNVQVSIGGQTGSGSTASTGTNTWISFTVDVTSLSAGTTYDVAISLKSSDANGDTYMDSIIGIAS